MLNEYLHPAHVFIACGYTDLRLGIDGLAALVQEKYQLDPFGEALFFFCGRRTDRIKGLFWDGDGFLLLYKRLERGRFQWPRNTEASSKILSRAQSKSESPEKYSDQVSGCRLLVKIMQLVPSLL